METNSNRILEHLMRHPDGADDDELADVLGIPLRQQVNILCRRLASNGSISRQKDPKSLKYVNRIVRDAQRNRPKARSTTRSVDKHPAQILSSSLAREGFVYTDSKQLTEDEVKAAVESALKAEGWEVQIQWGHDRGIDIEASRAGERMVIEAKGEGKHGTMRTNYFLAALGELLQHMDGPHTTYGLALPAHRTFIGLIERLPSWVQHQLSLRFYLVRLGERNHLEVAVILPNEQANQ